MLTGLGVTRVGIEGSGNYGWPAAIHLIDCGLAVVEVPPLLTSRERLSRPGQGKTDPIDAIAVARITARGQFLPPVRPMTGDPADLRVLAEYRDQLVHERTILANRVHVDLLWLRPGYQHQLPHLTNPAHLQAALVLIAGDNSVRATVTRARLDRMVALTEQLRPLRHQIGVRSKPPAAPCPRSTASAPSSPPPSSATSPTSAATPAGTTSPPPTGPPPSPPPPGGPSDTGSTAAATGN